MPSYRPSFPPRAPLSRPVAVRVGKGGEEEGGGRVEN